MRTYYILCPSEHILINGTTVYYLTCEYAILKPYEISYNT